MSTKLNQVTGTESVPLVIDIPRNLPAEYGGDIGLNGIAIPLQRWFRMLEDTHTPFKLKTNDEHHFPSGQLAIWPNKETPIMN